MKPLLGLCRLVDRVNVFVGRAVSWLLLAAIFVSAGNAIIRKIAPAYTSNAWLELQWYLFSGGFLLAAAYTLFKGEHVKIDLVYGRFTRRTQVWIEVFGTLVFLLPYCLVTILLVWPVVESKILSGEHSPNPGGLLMWPVWILIPIGFILLGLQGLSELVKRLAFLAGAGPDPGAEADEATADIATAH
ncbi:TRAP transporter small permease subunit [Prosthecomicrobium pneumaticum]|uniref:TRAP transporter small permease protein n=1 Tax=Prosthecomicrobium pneumaticum TaxID=81895 RepID=A0A7W9CVS5_9HYPH|nr:TRAP transporter small permease subunit [Prosthecomicrobium pneumaticum]MBB5752523.1 TRAP-type mannitol/chloroaromatic compound transport system permease small subunit [Prosthecomicrobium pneumaticum]